MDKTEVFTGEGGGEVTHSVWQRTMRRFTIFLKLAHNRECGLRGECYQKGDRAARGEAVAQFIAPIFAFLFFSNSEFRV